MISDYAAPSEPYTPLQSVKPKEYLSLTLYLRLPVSKSPSTAFSNQRIRKIIMSKQAVLDKIMAKAISRKLFTFLTATGLMLWSDLSSDTWGMIAMVYIGTQGAIDAMKEYRHG